MVEGLAFILKYWRVFVLVGLLAGMLGGAWGYVEKVKHDAYVSGHDAGYSEAQAKCDAEKRLMEAANKKASDEAAKMLADTAGKLELKEIQLDDYQKAIDLAADASPNAVACGIDADSVQRLGSIQ